MNKILSSLVIIVAATSVARADIASVQYVDDKTLFAGENVTINNGEVSVRTAGVYSWESDGETIQDSTPVSRSSIQSILDKILPTGWNTDDEYGIFCPDENDDSDYCWYGEGQSVSEYLTEVAETASDAYRLANRIDDDYQQKINGVAVWFDGEEVHRAEYGEGDIKTDTMVGIDEHGNVLPMGISTQGNGDFITGMHVDTLDDDEGLYQWPTLVLEKSGLPAAGSTTTPVYINSQGKAAAVSRIAASLLPVAPTYTDVVDHGLEMAPGAVYLAASEDDYNNMSEDYDYLTDALVPNVGYMKDAIAANTPPLADVNFVGGEDGYETSGTPGIVKGISIVTHDGMPVYGWGSDLYDGDNIDIQDGIITLPMASTNSDNAINPGAVWVAGTPEDVSALDSAVGLMPSEIVPTVEYMQNQKLIAGDNVTISEFDNTINVATATATKAGVAALGVIPAGTDKTSTATIWIE